ncbi:MAG: hypothetical protein IPJ71_00280 [Bdellovibrionales bacterium]|nr:hypothetical protein [Bdellovibrionales bacterium]
MAPDRAPFSLYFLQSLKKTGTDLALDLIVQPYFEEIAMRKLLGFVILSFALLVPLMSYAVKVKTTNLKKKAFFSAQEGENLYTPLDLKLKRFRFTPTDYKICGKVLVREEDSLSYSCTLELPYRSTNVQLREQLSPQSVNVKSGNSRKNVQIDVSEDGRFVTFTTDFDSQGLDFELAEFNEDFFKVYEKSALSLISEAMKRTPLRLQVLEN